MPLVARIAAFTLAVVALATCRSPARTDTTGTSSPAAAQAPSATADEPQAPAERRFDPDVVRVDPDSALGRARAALEAGRAEQASAIASQALAHGRGDDVERLWWVAARAQRENGEAVRAYQTLGNVADADHPLAPWAQLTRARMRLDVDPAGAATEVAPLVELEWAGQPEARDLHAAALVAAEDDAAEPILRTLVADVPEGEARASVMMPLADLLARSDDVERRVEALGLYRRVATRAPLSSAGREAETKIAALLTALPAARRRALAQPSPEDAFARAEALAAALQQEDAEAAFHEVATRTEDESLRCRARYGEGKAIYYRRERRRAADHLSAVARDCDAPEVRAWARYLAGRGYTMAGEHTLAIAQYGLLERDVATHSLADDARYKSALLMLDAGDEEEAVERLTTLPEAYPSGDMRGLARFMLAWRARRSGDREEALRQLEATLSEGPMEDREDLGGRAAYWRAVLLEELDRRDEAVEAFRAVAREFPLRYYGQQALVRLEALDAGAARAIRETLGGDGDGHITFAWRDELDTDAFGRALELLTVGAIEEARTELGAVREASGDADDELRWIEAALLDRAGAHDRSVYLTRRLLAEFMDTPPVGDHFARWRIAYPRAFASQIERAAGEQPIPPELVFAISREESSFRPEVQSIARAYGLTQLILPTAQRFGRTLGIRATPANLTDPETNVRVGAAYMGWLWERYEDNPVVLVPAYNAGQGSVDRWLRERPDQRLDEWIEEIPYDETRRYSRRVLQSWGIYTWLARRELPRLGAPLPPSGSGA